MKKSIEFYSEGSLIKGDLHFPDTLEEGKVYPALVLCHGFAGVKEMLLPNYAKRFAKEGYITLNFDYRGFGESEGERFNLNKANQIIDIRNAITYLQTLAEVDNEKIALWGTSYGGANAITVAAQDKRVKCLLAQLTFGNGERVIMGDKSEEERNKTLGMINKVWTRMVTQNKKLEMGIDRFLTDEQSIKFYNDNLEKFKSLDMKIPFITMKETLEHKPENFIGDINIPVFLVGAENDLVNPIAETHTLFEKANEPKAIHIVKGASHYEVYEGSSFEEVVSLQKDWLNKHLN